MGLCWAHVAAMLGHPRAFLTHIASHMCKLAPYPFSLRSRWGQTSELGANMAQDDPNMAQHGPNMGPTWGVQWGSGGGPVGVRLATFWLLGPSWSQDGPKMPPSGPSWPKDASKMPQVASKMPLRCLQDASKMPPRCLPDASKRPQDASKMHQK